MCSPATCVKYSALRRMNIDGVRCVCWHLHQYDHWINGVYLITLTTEDPMDCSFEIDSTASRDMIANRLGEGKSVICFRIYGIYEEIEASGGSL